jgi:P-type conjugative transfer protein TrbJ
MMMSRFRSTIVSTSIALILSLTAAQPAAAIIVFDPSNYAQSVITAARSLEQINNQIRSLQNQATSLINQARNLIKLPLTILAPLQAQIRQTQALLAQAQRMAYNVKQIEAQFAAQYKNIDLTAPQKALVAGAQGRWQTSIGAFEDALKVQAGVVGNIEGARTSMTALVSASQSSSGALQAAQAGNQLLALQAQQLADLTAMMASIGRAQSLEAGQRAAAQAQGREQLRRFLGTPSAYKPSAPVMFHN